MCKQEAASPSRSCPGRVFVSASLSLGRRACLPHITVRFCTHSKGFLPGPGQVWRHRIGTDPEADELVYHEEDEAFYVSLSRSRSNKLIFLDISAILLPRGRMRPALPRVLP